MTSTTTRPGLVIEKIFLSLLIFLIPSNLAFHFTSLAQLVDGVLVDYLIPRLYLSDILILSLLVTWVRRSNLKILKLLKALMNSRSSHKSVFNPQLAIITFFALTLLTSFFAPNPSAALWFWLKLLELLGLFLYLKSLKSLKLLKSLQAPLTLSVLWQSALSLAQYLKQGSIFPYWFLGESQFSATTPGVAKSDLFGVIKVLPYGTTPHPNVLGGFLAVSLVVLILFGKNANKKSLFWTGSKYITYLFGFTLIILTQSLSAIITFGLAIAAISHSKYRSTRIHFPLKAGLFLTTIVALVWVTGFFKTSLESESLSRRLTLTQAAIRMLTDHPLLGVGFNNFTTMLPLYGEPLATIRFLQPVHNIYLLLATETGLIWLAIVFIIFIKFIKVIKFRSSLPLLLLLTIGLADHYPLSLQTGQLLFAFTLVLASKND